MGCRWCESGDRRAAQAFNCPGKNRSKRSSETNLPNGLAARHYDPASDGIVLYRIAKSRALDGAFMRQVYVEILGPQPVSILKQCQGGFGDVFILSDDGVTPRHALKVNREALADSDALRREVANLARLPVHPHVVEIEGFTQSDIGKGLLMPFYPSSLLDAMGERMDVQRAATIASQILDGLQHLHKNGVLHLDLKPGNVLMSQDGSAVLSDFGLARAVKKEDLSNNPGLKLSNRTVSGTLLYMSPEQLLGMDLSAKSDVFALGVILYQMLTGRLPWPGNTVEEYVHGILYSEAHFTVAEKFNIPSWFRCMISICLSKNPDRRPPTAEIARMIAARKAKGDVTVVDADVVVRDISRAAALGSAGHHDEALQILERVTQQNPWNLSANVNLAEQYFNVGRTKDAINRARLATQLVPWNAAASDDCVLYLNLSLYLMSVDPHASYELTARMLQRKSDNWELMHNHAEACRLLALDAKDDRADLLAEGIKHAEAALRYRPDDEGLRVTYAGLLWQHGDRIRFVPYLNKLMQDIGDHSVTARVLYIDALIEDGKIDVAERQIRAVENVREFENVRPVLDQRLAEIAARRQRIA